MVPDPKAMRKAIMIAKAVASKVDPRFGNIQMPGVDQAIGNTDGGIVEDHGKTVPESPRTLELQRQMLMQGKRKAMLYTPGTPIPPPIQGIMGVRTPQGVIHYNPSLISHEEVVHASQNNRLNELLGLGPYSKDDVAEKVMGGEPLLAVVSRDQNGHEAVSAAGTPSTANEQIASLHEHAPEGGSVGIEPFEQVVSQRAQGGEVDYLPPGGQEHDDNLGRFLQNNKVRDEEGQHKVLYHATSKDFNEFKPGGYDPNLSGLATWMSPYKDHQKAAHNVGMMGGKWREGARVMPVYANIRSPLVLDNPEMLEWAKKVFTVKNSDFPLFIAPESRENLLDAGYDGIFYGGSRALGTHPNQDSPYVIGDDPEKNEEIIALHPPGRSQIKSAVGNNGQFDQSEPDIRKAFGGDVDYLPPGNSQREENLAKHMEGNHPLVPHVLYHGTDRDISSFDLDAKRRVDAGSGEDSTDTGWFGKGIYLTPGKRAASGYAGSKEGANVVPVHVSMKNPFIVRGMGGTSMDRALNAAGAPSPSEKSWRLPSEQTAWLKSKGHDGVIAFDPDDTGAGMEFVAFDPHQIKSAVGNRGQFDQSEPDIRKAFGGDVEPRDLNDQGLYSHAAEAAEALPQAKGTGQQMLASLKGVKPEELKWSGAQDAFADRPSVTRDELAQHFRDNAPKIQETVLKNEPPSAENDWSTTVGAKYSKYTIPGGENYREVLMHLPEKKTFVPVKDVEETARQNMARDFSKPNHDYSQEDMTSMLSDPLAGYDAGRRAILSHGLDSHPIMERHNGEDHFLKMGENYTGGHWGPPNVVAHLRLSDRPLPNGGKALHMEELQSDWAQNGRKEGFYDFAKPYETFHPEDGKVVSTHATEEEARIAAEATNHLDYTHGKIDKVPTAPYVGNTNSWTDLGLKRALTEAARDGHDKLIWTPGQEQADRYDLSKHIGQIHIDHPTNPDLAGKISLTSYGFGDDDWEEGAIDHRVVHPDELDDVVGKEVADRIRSRVVMPSTKSGYAVINPVSRNTGPIFDTEEEAEADRNRYPEPHKLKVIPHEQNIRGQGIILRDVDLKTGGEGMKGYYDNIVPKRLLALARDHDPEAAIGSTTISGGKTRINGMPSMYPEQHRVPSIDITPKMRESILSKGFKSFARGGDVEAEHMAVGGDIGDEGDDINSRAVMGGNNPPSPMQPVSQGSMMPPSQGFGGLSFPPEDSAARLKQKLNRDYAVSSGKKSDAGLPHNPRTIIKGPEGKPDFVTGNIGFDDWKNRHENILTPEEIQHSSKWYSNIFNNFLNYTNSDQPKATQLMRAWLVAQQNVSPGGAMNNVLLQKEQAARGVPQNLWESGGMPNPTEAARAVLSGRNVTGVGQKISDFVDSAEQKDVRSWMGNHPHGGSPFVVDVHTARDTGMVDPELISHLTRLGYDKDALSKLKVDLTGTPTAAAYENRAQWGRDLTGNLNETGWMGRKDWTPAEVQAVGWMGMTKLTRDAEEDSESGLGRNLRRISYEFAPGEGSPWSSKYGSAFDGLPPDEQRDLTEKMTHRALDHATKISGIDLHSIVHGTGAWERYQNPAAVAQTLSTQKGADIASNAIGHLLQQTEVWHNRVKPMTKNPKGFAIDFIENGSKNLADKDNLSDFWDKVMGADPHGLIRGYQPITLPTGEVGVRALIDKGGQGTQNKLEEAISPGGALHKILSDLPYDINMKGHEAEISKARNDWKEQKNGEGYMGRLVSLLGRDPSAELDSARSQLEKELEGHLDAAYERQGGSWRSKERTQKAPQQVTQNLPPIPIKARGGIVDKALRIAANAARR